MKRIARRQAFEMAIGAAMQNAAVECIGDTLAVYAPGVVAVRKAFGNKLAESTMNRIIDNAERRKLVDAVTARTIQNYKPPRVRYLG